MPVYSTTSFSQTGEGLFSTEEVQSLMNIEFDRARRYDYTIVAMVVSVDRLDLLQDMYGVETKQEVLDAVVELMESQTRSSDYLGCLVNDRIVAVFPHTSAHAANALAERLLKGAKQLAFAGNGRTMRITLSIGMAHNEDNGATSWETLLQVAEEGLSVAEAGGGDRSVETELYSLYETDEEAPAVESAAPTYEDELRRRLKSLEDDRDSRHAQKDAREMTTFIEKEVLDAALEEARDEARKEREEREVQQKELELLKRRLTKLTEQLGLTEQQLKQAIKLNSQGEGLASIYRTVQGLSEDDDQMEVKKELMGMIFEANLELRKRTAEAGSAQDQNG